MDPEADLELPVAIRRKQVDTQAVPTGGKMVEGRLDVTVAEEETTELGTRDAVERNKVALRIVFEFAVTIEEPSEKVCVGTCAVLV